MKKALLASLIILATISSCKDEEKDENNPEPLYELLELSTSYGEMYFMLFDSTPLHKNNFDSLVNAQFYDSTEFHRCVDDFVIQGGSPTSKDDNRNNDGSGSVGYTIPAEIDTTMFKHHYGAIAAARLGNMANPERRSSGSQFYIVTDPDGASFLDGEYTVFGTVLAGMDVAKEIEGQPKNSNGLPDERIKMSIRYVLLTELQLREKGIQL
ncbi:MAG: peptidylprolyl isomerase [Bacteroidia bacterium]